jgi:hypothetical protein
MGTLLCTVSCLINSTDQLTEAPHFLFTLREIGLMQSEITCCFCMKTPWPWLRWSSGQISGTRQQLRHGQMAPLTKSTVVEKRIKLNQTV